VAINQGEVSSPSTPLHPSRRPRCVPSPSRPRFTQQGKGGVRLRSSEQVNRTYVWQGKAEREPEVPGGLVSYERGERSRAAGFGTRETPTGSKGQQARGLAFLCRQSSCALAARRVAGVSCSLVEV
jgi:hypothetical protein